jgi:hypothetical protein
MPPLDLSLFSKPKQDLAQVLPTPSPPSSAFKPSSRRNKERKKGSVKNGAKIREV